MAFVNELIPEEQKDKFPFPVYTNNDGSKPTLWKWTIDRERDAYLVSVNAGGGGYDGTPERHYYVLLWKDEMIHFGADQYLSGSKVEDMVLTWKIHRLDISPALLERKDEVMQLIREALDAQGLVYNRNRVAAVNVEFNAFSH